MPGSRGVVLVPGYEKSLKNQRPFRFPSCFSMTSAATPIPRRDGCTGGFAEPQGCGVTADHHCSAPPWAGCRRRQLPRRRVPAPLRESRSIPWARRLPVAAQVRAAVVAYRDVADGAVLDELIRHEAFCSSLTQLFDRRSRSRIFKYHDFSFAFFYWRTSESMIIIESVYF